MNNLTLEFLGKYWFVCLDGKPLCSFTSLEVAMHRVPEAAIVSRFAVAA